MSEHSIGLALGAGGARGIAHVHVLRALDDLGLRPTSIAGTSIGAILGACYAHGMNGEDLREYLMDRFGDHSAILASIWELRVKSLEELKSTRRIRLGELDLERILERLLPPTLPRLIEDLNVETQIVATRYYEHDFTVFSSGPLLPAISASAAMPAVFHPVVINGVVHIDGGMTNPVPIDLLQDKASVIVGVDVSGGPEGEEGTIPGKIDVLYAASQLMQRTIIEEKTRRMRCDLLIQPKVGAWRVLDLMQTDEVLQATEPLYEETKAAVGRVLERGALAV